MMKRLLVFLMLIPILLAACNSTQAESAVGADAALEVAASPVADSAEAKPTTTDAPRQAVAAPQTSQMECTLVNNQPEAPAELVDIFSVTEDDWVQGSETAAVTILEYSDFQ